MPAQRIKGQEVECLLVVDGVPQSTITDIRNFEMEAKLEQLEEGYLGETTDRYDDIYKGIRGKMELHFENEDVFTLIASLIDRARRRTPGTQVNIKASLNFPNGDRARVLIPNVYFGALPLSFGSRTDYGNIALDFVASDFQVLTT